MFQNAESYATLDQTFHIMICDFKVFNDSKFLHRFVYADSETILNDICCIIYVELPKIKDRFNKPFNEMTDDERWALLIKYADTHKFTEISDEFQTEEAFNMAIDVLRSISKNEEAQMAYLSRLKYIMDERHNATIRREQAERRAKRAAKFAKSELERGYKTGMEQGIEQGAHQAKLEIARELLKSNIPLDIIASTTKLTISELQNL
jgi:predicted transposase/invertase (TIGR01784 family)